MGRWAALATAAACTYLVKEGAFLLLHLLYAVLARTDLEECVQFGSPPFKRDIKRLESS